MFSGTDKYIQDDSQVIMGLHTLEILFRRYMHKENVISLASQGLRGHTLVS